jgi:Ca2+/H+ antiporter, TMEM165/GDT1 family
MEAFLLSTASVAIGELGDKTQLLCLVLATRFRKPVPILLGVFAATLLNHLLACLFGEWASGLLTPAVLRWVLGLSFLAVAVWALFPDRMDEGVSTRSAHGVFMITAVTFFMAEMGDRTQIVAIALAARYHHLLPVVAGTTLGMMLVNIATVMFAERATRFLPMRWIRLAAALLYSLLGIATLAGWSTLLPR